MAKRKAEEAPKGAPAWQSTFADLMNLLLCFFVLLFSMSSVDAKKFEEIASSFSNTFSIFSAGGSSFDEGLLISNGVSQLNNLDKYINNTGAAAEQTAKNNDFKKDEAGGSESEENMDQMQAALEQAQLDASEELADKIGEALNENGLDEDVDVDFTSQYVLLTLKGSVLFDSGSAELKKEALPMIDKVSMILSRYAESTIEIEGHTDNVPISTSRFESNDVLSSYRALAMFNYLVGHTSLDPAKIKHSGRGEYIPVADNSTPEGRAKNRRIEIKIYNNLSSN
ncbi:MAG: flagellar motor protein MotB [Lachnospiraceae bacterium]|nr:flagellar motor protein MotB [Candidatus Colinaster scatohippi]